MKAIVLWMVVLPVWLGGAGPGQAAEEKKRPELKVAKVQEPPKIDGLLEDEAWKGASTATEFRLPYGEEPKGKTRLLMGQDGQCLYMAVECFEDEETLGNLVAQVSQHDGDGIWDDDEVEVFLDPTNRRQSYYQIIVNSRGITWDAYHESPGQGDTGWEPKYEAAAQVGKTNWTVELALPWAMFDRTEKFEAAWAFNVFRLRKKADEKIYWSPVFSSRSHTPENFGTLVGIRQQGENPHFVGKPPAQEKVLFDFEEATDLQAWSSLELPEGPEEPPIQFELSAENATSGRHSLKITFAGGNWPTITTSQVPDDWMPFQTFKADVTVGRPCLVGFQVLQERSSRGGGWDATVSRWVKTAFLQPGRNEVSAPLHLNDWSAINPQLGKVTTFEVFMYHPHEGEVVYVDNIRLTTAREVPRQVKTQFTVLGTDLEVSGVQELGEKLKGQWTPPQPRTVEQVEAEFRAAFEELKKAHPRAILAIFRDGEKGYDPAHPDRVYAGWKDAYWSSHGPDGMTLERSQNFGQAATHEIFMRHRSPLMRVDLSSIPRGSDILAARLVLVRASEEYDPDRNPLKNPNMWVAEACNRPWEETEVNAYEYARDRFWKEIGGMDWEGDDPDFLPLYLAHGPGQGQVNVWDFTEAVRYWTDGQHKNHGFMLHGDSYDWLIRAYFREALEVQDRPALLVIYEPKG